LLPSIREMEGAIDTVYNFSKNGEPGNPITYDTVVGAFSGMYDQKKIFSGAPCVNESFEQAKSDIARYTGISTDDMQCKLRKPEFVLARNFTAWVLSEMGESPKNIGEVIKRKHPASLNAIGKVRDILRLDINLLEGNDLKLRKLVDGWNKYYSSTI